MLDRSNFVSSRLHDRSPALAGGSLGWTSPKVHPAQVLRKHNTKIEDSQAEMRVAKA